MKTIWFAGWFDASEEVVEWVEEEGASQERKAACAIVAAEK